MSRNGESERDRPGVWRGGGGGEFPLKEVRERKMVNKRQTDKQTDRDREKTEAGRQVGRQADRERERVCQTM